MANPTPQTVFGPNFSSDTVAKTFTFTYTNDAPNAAFDLPEIADGDVDPTTGDARTLIYALLEKIAEWYEALPVNSRPEYFRIVRSGTLSDVGGQTYIQRTYNAVFKTGAGSLILIDEA